MLSGAKECGLRSEERIVHDGEITRIPQEGSYLF